MGEYKWEVINKSKSNDIVDALLDNRGIKTKKERKEFFKPRHPDEITLEEYGIDPVMFEEAIKRIKKALFRKDKIVVFGDYDADGIAATAIVWEALYKLGANVMPYIPDRFSEGYGMSTSSIDILLKKYPDLSLLITVDNGITANEAISYAKENGIDVIVTDHHQPGEKKPKAHSFVHSTKICGSGVAYVLANKLIKGDWLELAAIGTISDQMPLLSVNRSIVKYGLADLSKTKREGLIALFEQAALETDSINAYHVGFIIAPRLNAMGRMSHSLDSLRLICTKDSKKAKSLAMLLNEMNTKRQKVVEESYSVAKEMVSLDPGGIIAVSHESFHEGIIGLIASNLVEEFYRPSIVISKGKILSKASARSIAGFNIIESIRKFDNYLVSGGGHPMAAGFTIRSEDVDKFIDEFNDFAKDFLNDDILRKTLRVDLEIGFDDINWELQERIEDFEPLGLGNPRPSFLTRKVRIVEKKAVGKDGKHLKFKLGRDGREYSAIAFGFGDIKIDEDGKIDLVYGIEKNSWNGHEEIQLNIKDVRVSDL